MHRNAPTPLPTYVLRPWEIMRLSWRSVSVSELQVIEASRQDWTKAAVTTHFCYLTAWILNILSC